MEFYTLHPTDFSRVNPVIDTFESAIWTERFIEPGDFKLVLPVGDEVLDLLPPGTLVNAKDTRYVMLVETREIKDGAVEVSGRSAETFFETRPIDKFTTTKTNPEAKLFQIANRAQGRSVDYGGGAIGWGYIFNLETSTGYITWTAPNTRSKIAAGDAYSAMIEIARKYQIDLMLIKGSSSFGMGLDFLEFRSYLGVDRTGSGPSPNIVRFSPKQDNLANVRELLSVKDHFTHVVVWPTPGLEYPSTVYPVFLKNTNVAGATPFTKRYHEIYMTETAEDIAELTSGSSSSLWPLGWQATLASLQAEKASEFLVNHKKTRLVEGEIVTENSQYVYGAHYKLGDFVEMEGYFGTGLKGKVVEYVRSQDATGERAYPTVSMDPTPAMTTGD